MKIFFMGLFVMVVNYYIGRYFWKYKGAVKNEHGEIIGYRYSKSNDRFIAFAIFSSVLFTPVAIYFG